LNRNHWHKPLRNRWHKTNRNSHLALTLNGKKKKIKRNDFKAAFTTLHLDAKQQENIFKKMENSKSKWMDLIDDSFLTGDFKDSYKELVEARFERVL
jgi:serine/threonine-protein kinase HipA